MKYCYAECFYSECRYVEWRGAHKRWENAENFFCVCSVETFLFLFIKRGLLEVWRLSVSSFEPSRTFVSRQFRQPSIPPRSPSPEIKVVKHLASDAEQISFGLYYKTFRIVIYDRTVVILAMASYG